MKKITVNILILLLLAALLGQPVSPVNAAGVLYAAADGLQEGLCPITAPCTIQRAVSRAAAGDTIFLESGNYIALNEADSRVIWITKSLNLTGSCDFSSGSAICSPANEPSIINGELERRAIHIQITDAADPGEVELNYLDIRLGNGRSSTGCLSISPYTTIGCGGGIYSNHQSKTINLLVNSCEFWGNIGAFNDLAPGNEAAFGGAIYYSSTDNGLEVNNSIFWQNAAIRYGIGDGGAIFLQGNELASFSNNYFVENNCSWNSADSKGCGIMAQFNAEVIIDRNLFNLNNHTGYLIYGSAIYLDGNDHFSVQRNILTENTGAAVIYGISSIVSGSPIPADDFSQNWIWNNNATNAIFYTGYNAVSFTNNFIGHLSSADPNILSGIRVLGLQDQPRLITNILHNSIAYLDHGITLDFTLNATIKNNIIAYNRVDAVDSNPTISNAITIFADTNMIYANPAGDLTGPNLITANPRFVDGPNGNFHLQPNSPAINAGIPLGYVIDIDDQPRSLEYPDIGADEYVVQVFLPIIQK